jgi:GNAT superfamily N-acetyltransferase
MDAVDIEQTDDVAAFLPGILGNDAEYYRQLFRHWWDLNPAWDRKSVKGWAVHQGGQVVAFTANIPLPYVHDGGPASCYATGCTAVDERFRGRGFSKLIGGRFVAQQAAGLLLATRSTPVAFRLWQSLGMKPLAPWRRPIRVLGDSSELLAMLGLRPLGGMARLATRCLASMYRPKAECAQVSAFEASDEADLEKCRASNEGTFALRDVRTLNWLYFGTEFLRATRMVLVARSWHRLIGYAAFKTSGHNLELLECRCEDADPGIARALLLKASELARARQIGFVRVRPYSDMIVKAIPSGLAFSDLNAHPTYCALSPAGWPQWEATPGDGDFALN